MINQLSSRHLIEIRRWVNLPATLTAAKPIIRDYLELHLDRDRHWESVDQLVDEIAMAGQEYMEAHDNHQLDLKNHCVRRTMEEMERLEFEEKRNTEARRMFRETHDHSPPAYEARSLGLFQPAPRKSTTHNDDQMNLLKTQLEEQRQANLKLQDQLDQLLQKLAAQ
jgi:hypothetical protein